MPKTAIITGAGGGVAASTIEVFATAGWQLALFVRSGKTRDALRERHPDSLVCQVDLTSESQSRQAVAQTAERFAQVDALLNIAGGFAMSPAEQTSHNDLEKQLDLNLRTLFNATRAVLPGMLERGSGFILGVGAGAALTGGARMGTYAASKAAAVAYLKSLQAELGPKGIGVSILYPMGAIDTPANRTAMPNTDPQRWIDPRELAEAMLFLATRGPRGRVKELQVFPPA